MITIKLKYPIEFAGRKITELKMRRAKAADFHSAQKQHKADEDRELAIFANLTENEPEALKQLDMADYKQLQTALEGFLS